MAPLLAQYLPRLWNGQGQVPQVPFLRALTSALGDGSCQLRGIGAVIRQIPHGFAALREEVNLTRLLAKAARQAKAKGSFPCNGAALMPTLPRLVLPRSVLSLHATKATSISQLAPRNTYYPLPLQWVSLVSANATRGPGSPCRTPGPWPPPGSGSSRRSPCATGSAGTCAPRRCAPGWRCRWGPPREGADTPGLAESGGMA